MKQETKPLNKRIATYRKLSGYTQQGAADALGMKKNTYARMELHGNPTPELLVKIANLFGVSVDQLLFEVDLSKINVQSDPLRLHEEPRPFKRRPGIVLTVNEENCIKVCRQLLKDQQKQVMALINKLYKENKNNG